MTIHTLTHPLTHSRGHQVGRHASRTRSLADLVGHTPLIRLQHVTRYLPQTVEVYAKAEWFNPSGSIKDRPALAIIQAAEASGELTRQKTLLDSTSGNMGIAYATLAGPKGYPVRLVLPENVSPERIEILRALGADLTFSPALEGSDGAMAVARALAAEQPDVYFYANQYDNPANWLAHYHTTGPEVIHQTRGRVTHFVAGLGTSGTLMGAGRALKAHNPRIQLVAVQPASPLHGIEGLKHMPSAQKPGIYVPALADQSLAVSTEDAYAATRRLAREEGLFTGVSSGAALSAALRVAETLSEGVVVAVFPDAGYKYLSERFWREV